MNEIEKNDIKDKDRALDYLVPSTVPQPLIPLMKQRLLNLAGESIILRKANIMYYNDHIQPYLDFYMKYLSLAGEDASIISFDNGKICISHLLDIAYNNKPPTTSIPDTSNEIWLYIHAIKNEQLKKYLVDCWRMTDKYIANTKLGDKSVYIKLAPAVTCKHLDDLYRAISAYE